jgi:hypothetical protein
MARYIGQSAGSVNGRLARVNIMCELSADAQYLLRRWR